ncbi:DUF3159 domain-containing protein [Actinokineospora auranticolor]|uniref:Uncharacterized protein DUF3159 n=1 Tax=Actinokineospora auranticolor TaxID=155976 RepID=A0A2S6GZE1_9PSEU|nr:DUF3159 domain-containing protein [Actinokineospora auranticolor]PPK70604.1 uncharacterized protein DUF3159 [Actinokineospora auranticolor]
MTDARSDSLSELLGGRRGAVDATIPPLAFAVGWLVSGNRVEWGAAAALLAATLVAAFRLNRGGKVTAVVGSILAVVAGSLVALITGRGEDFFVVQLLSNIASALAWAISILIRWPLLGVVVGTILGQKTRWRRDPDLLRAYSRASWVWVFLQYTLRTAVFALFWWTGSVTALAVSRVALSWPLVAVVVAASAAVLRKSLPPDHPGLRHPRAPELADKSQ